MLENLEQQEREEIQFDEDIAYIEYQDLVNSGYNNLPN